MSTSSLSNFYHIAEDRKDEFVNKGYKGRHFFPHRIYHIPKGGPDGLKMSHRMCGINDPSCLWEIILYASYQSINEFPEELFFDDEIIWHQQQFGRAGQIATANIVIDDDKLYGMNYISDLVQRISRRRNYKTRIENRYKGWPHILLNSILNFALEKNIKTIYSPTADFVIANTDPSRHVQRELFDRIYDRAVCRRFHPSKKGRWWKIDVDQNSAKLIKPEKKEEIIKIGKTICLCHDIEKGYGHIGIDQRLVKEAEKKSKEALREMLAVEKEMKIKATYNVLGCLFNELRNSIEKDGHCIAFHSYDHKIETLESVKGKKHYYDQLFKCRQVDYRIKGYRFPQSKITPELSDENLAYHNFEWIASSVNSLKIELPKMQNGIVKIPILFDDYGMYKAMSYDDWENKAINLIKQNDFIGFGLHDCYAHYWLPHYRKFLDKIRNLGKFKTLNEVASEVIFTKST